MNVIVFLGKSCKCNVRKLRLIITNRYWFGPMSARILESNGKSKLSNGEVVLGSNDDDGVDDASHSGIGCCGHCPIRHV